MLNPFKTIDWTPDYRKIRSCAILFAIGFILLSVGAFLLKLCSGAVMIVVIICVAGCSVGAMIFPKNFGLWFYRIWFALSATIGLVMGNLLFGGLFFLIFTPFALALRGITRRDLLHLHHDRNENSGWKKTDPVEDEEEYFHQY